MTKSDVKKIHSQRWQIEAKKALVCFDHNAHFPLIFGFSGFRPKKFGGIFTR